jgi:hypothetical protein
MRKAKEALPSMEQAFNDMSSTLPQHDRDTWTTLEKKAQAKRRKGITVERADDLAIYDVCTSKGLSTSWHPLKWPC